MSFKQNQAPARPAGASENKTETLAREVFASIMANHPHGYQLKQVASVAIEAAEAFYEIWDLQRAKTNGIHRQD